MVRVLASSAVDRGFEPRSGQTKDYKIGICCLNTKGNKNNYLKTWTDIILLWYFVCKIDANIKLFVFNLAYFEWVIVLSIVERGKIDTPNTYTMHDRSLS
jgi:hypothetical protein